MSNWANVTRTDKEAERFGAITSGYYLGILASTYSSWIPEYVDSNRARNDSTMLVKASADFLDIKLVPDPDTLLSEGRGLHQYEVIESYFRQFQEGTKERSQCTQNLVGMSLSSGWLVLNTYEAEQITNPDDAQKFKEHFLERLTIFGALTGSAAIFCKEDGQTELSIMLQSIYEDSEKWRKSISLAEGYGVVGEAKRFRNDLEKWFFGLQRISEIKK